MLELTLFPNMTWLVKGFYHNLRSSILFGLYEESSEERSNHKGTHVAISKANQALPSTGSDDLNDVTLIFLRSRTTTKRSLQITDAMTLDF